MKNRFDRFNTYLLMAVVLAASCGCQTKDDKQKKKEPPPTYTSLHIHLEGKADATKRTYPVPVFRAHPYQINIEKEAILDQRDIVKAAVTEELGGFGLRLQFDPQGTLLLEQYTGSNTGRRLVIFAQFVCATNALLVESRWLGAPRITRRISDGVLVFTPDASREETTQIVLGLNNVARKAHDKQ